MLPETLLSLKIQAPARLRALSITYGIATSKSTAARAVALAPTVKAFRPAVYQVGSCVCDLWRMACTCQTARNHTRAGIKQADKPCPHFVALYLVGEWTPIDSNPVAYLQSVGVEKPELIAMYARVPDFRNPYRPGKYITARIMKGQKDIIAELPTGEFWAVKHSEIRHLLPFYE
jgi:hypothetical protein